MLQIQEVAEVLSDVGMATDQAPTGTKIPDILVSANM